MNLAAEFNAADIHKSDVETRIEALRSRSVRASRRSLLALCLERRIQSDRGAHLPPARSADIKSDTSERRAQFEMPAA